MAAYIIFDVEVTDPTLADDYLKLANESLTPFQSKTIVHGGVVEVLEGDWKPETLVMLEFESKEQAQQWYKSPAYTKAKEILLRAASTNVILVEGSVIGPLGPVIAMSTCHEQGSSSTHRGRKSLEDKEGKDYGSVFNL